MTITETTTVGDIAAALPSSVRVFQRHGIDFCCGGRKELRTVCDEQRLSFTEIAQAIEAAAADPAQPDRDWASAPLHELVDHIVTTYHDPLREELPRLQAMAARVAEVHGTKEPRLLQRIDTIASELAADLDAHMRKEEMVLFPGICAREAGGAAAMPLAQPIRVMEWEHDRAGELLAELRTLTAGYALPAWACATVRALYQGLAELEAAMHVHVHLENNVLFPRASALAHR